jgi:CBS domain-containing protein
MTTPMSAGDVCMREVTIAEPETPVIDAARLMRANHVGCIVVVRETAHGPIPIGVLTDRDIATAIVAQDVDLRSLRVEDVMTSGPVTAGENDTLFDVLGLMRGAGVRRVPVVGANGELIGLVALDDLLGLVSSQMQAIVAAIGSEQKTERLRRA